MKLTDAQVRNLKPKGQRYEVWEDGGRGFGVRITPRGIKSFVFLYRFHGRNRRLTLGNYPAMSLAEARKLHAESWEKLQKGIDPGAEVVTERQEDRKAPTVMDLAHEYLEKWAKPRKRSWKVDERILRKDVLPDPPAGAGWGRRKAKEITRRDVIHLLDKIVERGAGIMANRTLAVVRKMFNFAVTRDILSASPCTGVQAPAPENQRDRVLTPEEIKVFWNGLQGEHFSRVNAQIRLVLKLELITAQRKAEICAAAWEEVDLEEGWWTIPGEVSVLRQQYGVDYGLAKNRLPHRVPLTTWAKEVFQEAKALAGDSPWCFPSFRTHRPITPPAVNHAVRLHRETLGLSFVPHDLRRTAASHMTGMGIPRLVVSKILNHVERGVTAVYDRHSYDREKRQALEAWAHRLQAIIQGTEEEGKIIPLIRGT